MERITRRIGESIDFVDGKGYASLSNQEKVRLLFTTLAKAEDTLEKDRIMSAYFKVEDFLYGIGKDKPLEIKVAMIWGALSVVCNNGNIDSNEMKTLFGEFVSKQMKLV